ncbi:MAG: glycosyltransferase family 2 protein [Clostridia bacterium]|nr:glycosyltransferase family 2 protein [Clostridia bacterium]
MEHSAFRLSVIVPAHNAAAFLERCADSVRAQTMPDWELLIVENGSTDDTRQIAARLEQEDPRIRLLTSEKGVSHARNEGVRCATGEYITFLDADDWLLPDAFAFFAAMVREHPACDMVTATTDRLGREGEVTVYEQADMEAALCRFLQQPTAYLTVWGKLYRTAFLRDSGVSFDPRLTHAEDSDYLIRLLGGCRQLVVTAQPLYHYYINPTSAVHGGQSGLEEKYRVSLETTADRVPFGAAARRAYDYYVLDNLLVLLVHDTFRPGRHAPRRQAAAVLDIPVFRRALERADLSCVGTVKRVVFTLAKKRMLLPLEWAIRVRQWQNRHRK